MIRLPLLGRLFIPNRTQNVSTTGYNLISTYAFPLQFKTSPLLCAEPLKKKKRTDPAVIKAREEKKKKRIMKEIRKLQKEEKILKPIGEYEVPDCLKIELERRKRIVQVPEEVAEERLLLLKKWSQMKKKEALSDGKLLSRFRKSQQEALNELRLESEELYQAAVRIDPNLIPFKYSGPTETPPIEDYMFPDGAYIDKSKKWI